MIIIPQYVSTFLRRVTIITQNSIVSAGANPADAPIIDPLDVFAGSKNYTPSIPDYSKVTGQYASRAYQLNQRLNELLFDALQLDIVRRTQLATQPFVVLKQMKYSGGEHSDLADAGMSEATIINLRRASARERMARIQAKKKEQRSRIHRRRKNQRGKNLPRPSRPRWPLR